MTNVTADPKREAMLEKVRALIDKAEKTNFAEEAEAFMNKAQELLTKYAIDEAELDFLDKNREDRDKIITIVMRVSNPHAAARVALLAAVARSNNVKLVNGGVARWTDLEHFREKYDDVRYIDNTTGKKRSVEGALVYLTGFSRDIDATTLLFTSLMIQAAREFARLTIPSYENKLTYYKHFVLGFSSGVQSRLTKATEDAVTTAETKAQESGGSILPVLANRKAQVDAEFEARWGGRLSKGRSRRLDYSRGGGAGYAAGKRADVGNVKVQAGGRKALGA